MARFSSLIVGALVLFIATATHAAPSVLRGGVTGWLLSKGNDNVYQVLPSSSSGAAVATRSLGGGSLGSGSVAVADAFAVTGPGGSLPLTVSRQVDWDHVAVAGVAGLAATKSPWGGGASAAYDLWNQLRTKPDGQGGLLRDTGASPNDVQVMLWSANGPPGTYATAEAACASTGYPNVDMRGDNFAACRTASGGGPYAFVTGYMTTQKQCPAVTDMSGTIPGGLAGIDGKCPTGRYTAASQAEIRAMLDSLPAVQTAAQTQAQNLVQDALNRQTVDITPQSQSLTGPSSQSLTPTTETTTNPDGTTATKTVTPTYSYTYTGGDTITYQITNTTVNNNNGQTTTTTTTTNSNGTAVDICKANPTASACAELGTADVTRPSPEQKPLSITQQSMPSNAGCPAPLSFAVMGHEYAVSWQPVCDASVTWVRPVILVVAFALAAWVFVGGLQA